MAKLSSVFLNVHLSFLWAMQFNSRLLELVVQKILKISDA